MKYSSLFACLIAVSVWAAGSPDKIKLRDGTELEGNVSNVDGKGFTLTSRFGTLHYDWAQVDLDQLRKTNRPLYNFMEQQRQQESAQDLIQTERQVYRFLSGGFSFKSAANKDLMRGDNHNDYGRVLAYLDAAAQLKQLSNRDVRLRTLISTERVPLRAFNLRCSELLKSFGKNSMLNSILSDYQRSMDALFSEQFSTFCQFYVKARKATKDQGH